MEPFSIYDLSYWHYDLIPVNPLSWLGGHTRVHTHIQYFSFVLRSENI